MDHLMIWTSEWLRQACSAYLCGFIINSGQRSSINYVNGRQFFQSRAVDAESISQSALMRRANFHELSLVHQQRSEDNDSLDQYYSFPSTLFCFFFFYIFLGSFLILLNPFVPYFIHYTRTQVELSINWFSSVK